ncbi:hypothetical protein KEM56_007810 [Ascosphaera pollenicola]|nr:hypothetical protein KEM56_007810 [Ascosphaera pollenicola]
MFLDYLATPWTPVVLFLLWHIIPYFRLWSLHDIPGPFLAKFSNIYAFYLSRRGIKYLVVDALHDKHGKFVRIQPNHISVADDAAIKTILGHGLLKADYYDAFYAVDPDIFATRNKADHTRKRKLIAHTYSPKSVKEFEPLIESHLNVFIRQWNSIVDWHAKEGGVGPAIIDALPWLSFLAIDVIGDLAFGAPFGMLAKGQDEVEIRVPGKPVKYVPAVRVFNGRDEVGATIGHIPWLKSYAGYLPDAYFRQGASDLDTLAGLATTLVRVRIEQDKLKKDKRPDILTRLMEARDQCGKSMSKREIESEALTQMVAGSDTVANTTCSVLYHIVNTPRVKEKLQRLILEAIPENVRVPTCAQLKDIPYVTWVINEAMRVHNIPATGLPREVPPGPPVDVCGRTFKPGTVLSIPIYTVHHSKKIWGPDADEFRPERFDPEVLTARQKEAFMPFSYGPRACVGRNLAEMEVFMIIGTIMNNFDVDLQQGQLKIREGFVLRPLGLNVGVKRLAKKGLQRTMNETTV